MKIWFDLCEPKAVIYLKHLYDKLIGEHDILITVRDFDSTIPLMEKWGKPYIKVGEHGGKDLSSKLDSFVNRLHDLLSIVKREKPQYLFSMATPEATRIAYGLGIPNMMFYDEPRSVGCSTLTLPMTELAIVSKYIPFEWYSKYGISRDRVNFFNGIDEVGWLNPKIFSPNESYLSEISLQKFTYLVIRPEATKSYSHKGGWFDSDDSILSNLIPKIVEMLEERKDTKKILLISRYKQQYYHFLKLFTNEIKNKRIILRDSVNHLQDIMYFSTMVISGGGTMVRESAMLGVPSIEFIPSETYPQEKFLIENNFPLVHVKEEVNIMNEIVKILDTEMNQSLENRNKQRMRIAEFDDPIEIGYNEFLKRTSS